MIQITKIFRFEMAHAIHGYPGKCHQLHGHSYQLHVSITAPANYDNYLTPPGFIMDFKDLKQLVNEQVINHLDHSVVLSAAYLKEKPEISGLPNLVTWQHEPTAENMLIFIKNNLQQHLPAGIQLVKLKLYETSDSYAEWISERVAPKAGSSL